MKIALACVAILVFFIWQGFSRTLIVALLGSVLFFVVPLPLVGDSSVEWWGGISSGVVGIRAFAVIIVVALVMLAARKKIDSYPWQFLPFLLFAAVMTIAVWGNTVYQWSGFIHILLGVLAWMLGVIGGRFVSRDTSTGTFLLVAVSAVVIGEAFIAILQVAGFDIFELSGRTAELMGDRANGTFFHPNKIGQMLIPLMLLVLPYVRSATRPVRLLALTTMLFGFVAVLLSGSRTNSVALLLVVVAWVALSRKDLGFLRLERLPKFVVPSVAVVATLGVLSVFFSRLVQDGTDEARGHLLQAAFEQIARTPWLGVGLNSYVEVVGQYDELTAAGWPVHNILASMIVEVGIVGAILFFVPVAWSFVLAWRARGAGGTRADFAKTYVAFLPALLVMGSLDVGLITDSNLVVWFIVSGFCIGQFGQDTARVTAGKPEILRWRDRWFR